MSEIYGFRGVLSNRRTACACLVDDTPRRVRQRSTQYNAAVDRLLEATSRAERDHFWFHGFRQFVTPLLKQAAGDRPGLRLLD
jgi:hypothetical protein